MMIINHSFLKFFSDVIDSDNVAFFIKVKVIKPFMCKIPKKGRKGFEMGGAFPLSVRFILLLFLAFPLQFPTTPYFI